MERHCHRLRCGWSAAALLLPFLILAALPERLCAAATWDAWQGDDLEIRIRDGAGLAKIPDPATFGDLNHPFRPPHLYSGPPPWFLNFLQIGSDQHPQLGSLLAAYQDFAGKQITRSGIHDDVLVLELVNNTSQNLEFTPINPLSFSFGQVPGPGTTDTPGVLIDPGPLVPLPAFRPYPEVPYPTQPGNVLGTYNVNPHGGSSGGQTSFAIPWIGVIPPFATSGARYLVLRITPQFPGAWRLAINFGIYRTIHVGGIAEPPLTRQGVAVQMQPLPSPTPSSPSESRTVYRIYNVGKTDLNLTDLSFASASPNAIKVLEVLDQSGAVIPPYYPKPYGLPTVIPAYDGIESFDTGPYAYTGGSSPVAPWVDVVLGVSPPPGNFSYNVLANYTNPSSSVQWTVSGLAVLSPEIQTRINGVNLRSGVTVVPAGNVVNQVQGRGKEFIASISNIGNQPLNLGVPTFVGTNASGEIRPGGSWPGTAATVVPVGGSVTVRFRVWPTLADPPDAGPFAMQVRIPTNDVDENPFVIVIQGTATPRLPRLEVIRNGRSIPKGGADVVSQVAVAPAPPTTATYTLRNTGDRPLTIASVALNGAPVATDIANPIYVPGAPLPAVNPVTLAVGATTTFDLEIQASNATDSYRIPLQILSNTGSADPAPIQPFNFQVTDYKSDGGEGRECGFGSPFGFLLLIGGLLLWRRRAA